MGNPQCLYFLGKKKEMGGEVGHSPSLQVSTQVQRIGPHSGGCVPHSPDYNKEMPTWLPMQLSLQGPGSEAPTLASEVPSLNPSSFA